MKLRPDMVLIRADKAKEQADEGFYIQEEWKELPSTGVVEEVGALIDFCKKGDKVFFSRYSAIAFPGDPDLRICTDDGVFAVL